MHRVDSDGHASNLFEDKDAGAGKAGTALTQDWHNDTQEEICTIIEDAGITLVKGTQNQLQAAIMNKRVYTSGSGTFTTPAGVTLVYLTMVGGGGAGEQATNNAGGGGGGAIKRYPFAVTAATGYSYGVGAGGTTDGANGGDTTFSTLSCEGGDGGTAGGAGGSVTGAGTDSIDGGAGGANGGNSAFSPQSATYADGVAFGGGGSSDGTADFGEGGDGILIIEW